MLMNFNLFVAWWVLSVHKKPPLHAAQSVKQQPLGTLCSWPAPHAPAAGTESSVGLDPPLCAGLQASSCCFHPS